MELRTINPRKLKFNPNNPRRTKVAPEQDAQLTANILAQGLLQPPIVREDGDTLVVIAGERRVRCSIKAKLAEIHVLVRNSDDGGDAMRALAENVVRAEMCSVDLWRHIEAMLGSDQGWNEQGIANALNMSVRSVKRLRLLANIHPAILDHMTTGDEPDPEDLAAIANAPIEEQEEVWKRNKPKKGNDASWWNIVNPLKKRRLLRKHARFGDELARKFGIAWEDDLFGQGGDDNLYTTKAEEFFAAQTEWLAASLADLHPRACILTVATYGGAELPAGAQRAYGQPEDGDEMGFYLDRHTGAVESIPFRVPVRSRASRDGDGASLPKSAAARGRRDAEGGRHDRRLPHRCAASSAAGERHRRSDPDRAARPRPCRQERHGAVAGAARDLPTVGRSRADGRAGDRGRSADTRPRHGPGRGAGDAGSGALLPRRYDR